MRIRNRGNDRVRSRTVDREMNEIFYDLMLAGIALLLFGPRVMCMYLMAMTAYYMMRTVQIFTNKRRR